MLPNRYITVREGNAENNQTATMTMEPKHNDEHARTYLVQCWVHPSSGMDLVDKNRVMEEMKAFLGHVFVDDQSLEDGMKQFEKQVDGLVLHPFFMKSWHHVDDPEKEFMSKIQETHPEAKYASSQEVPNSK